MVWIYGPLGLLLEFKFQLTSSLKIITLILIDIGRYLLFLSWI